MKTRIAVYLAAGTLAGCASHSGDISSGKASDTQAQKSPVQHGTISTALTYEAYKRDLAQRIAQINAAKVYSGRPQALLRSVVVVKYVVDAHGNMIKSELIRSNRDGETEATALASLKSSAPFPKPAPHLLRGGKIEISETWLFNNDGRFQLRTIAQPQIDS
ncbi:MAG TPA: hypothetical protein VF427_02565 [Noviherbaspirillum sp.]